MKRSRHRAAPVPWYTPRPVVLDDEYEAQVQRSTERLERAYARAERRAEQAEHRLARAQQERVKRHQIAELTAELERRRAELEHYRRLMQSVPASAQHRGCKSYHPVPARR